ncbi:MAG: PAS domain-containing protein [Bacteroidales bacterium]|nr:PAS domain-containing protein [Bacteroidales bacterium]MCF8404230.1 PAS domain-containing protein [Bacteroidales bacterium]
MKAKSIDLSKPSRDFYFVGIGASAGGLEAFERFFKHVPDNPGMAFILVSHLDPKHHSIMPELIRKYTTMEVLLVKDGTKVKPNAVYIIPPNFNMAILKGTLHLFEPPKKTIPRMPIDFFFKSLANDQGEKAICIILSGMGSDGCQGLKVIKGELGMAMAQSVDSAKYESMPKCAIETSLVDYILPPEKMPEQLLNFTNHIQNRHKVIIQDEKKLNPDALQKIFILLRNQTGHDFSSYKINTISRRISRRMNIHQINRITTFVKYLQENPLEVETLFRELLIGVTSFFRDKYAFELMRENILPGLLKQKPSDYTFRVWIPGCSSGEEAYSIAIILREVIEKLNIHINIQIFATDLDINAIEIARAGLYPPSIAQDVSPERIKRFFSFDDHLFKIKKDIRELLVFAPQNLIKDPPFIKLDMVVCRNLLIYFDSDLQKKVLPLFHFSLKPEGVLFLGSSETIGSFTDLFLPINTKWKIYARKQAITPNYIVSKFHESDQQDKKIVMPEHQKIKPEYSRLAEKSLLAHYAPPSVIINERGEILYIHGRTGKYLEPAPGEANLNIYDMARDGLRVDLTAAIRESLARKQQVVHKGVSLKNNGAIFTIDIVVKPLNLPKDPQVTMLIMFEESISPEPPPSKTRGKKTGKKEAADQNENDRMTRLEKELQSTKENLQSTIEELEASNEELKSTNEELQSTNEELQSTNEELETSKEEQQSMNEELSTVNAELNEKVEMLAGVNDDLSNLLNATQIPTIFLDNEFRIKRFTSHTARIIHFIQTDIGRPISDINTKLVNVNIKEIAKEVLNDLVFREKEVMSEDGAYYTLRISPYRTTENVINGVVITFSDLTKVQEIKEQELRYNAEARLAKLIKESNDAIFVLDLQGNITEWNYGAEKMYGYSQKEALKLNLRNLSAEFNNSELEAVLKRLQEKGEIKSFKSQRKTKENKIINVWLTPTRLLDADEKLTGIGITERDLAWLPE